MLPSDACLQAAATPPHKVGEKRRGIVRVHRKRRKGRSPPRTRSDARAQRGAAKAESDEREKAGAPGGLTGLFSLREQFVKTKRDSVDRDNKATLPLTSARFVFKSSASESSNRVKKL